MMSYSERIDRSSFVLREGKKDVEEWEIYWLEPLQSAPFGIMSMDQLSRQESFA